MIRSPIASLLSAAALLASMGLVSVAACGGSTTAVNDADGGGNGNGQGSGSGGGSSGGGADGSTSDGGGSDGSVGDGGKKKVLPHVPAIHRATAIACSHDRGPGDFDPQTMNAQCTSDADCTMGADGRCLRTKVAAQYNYCSYDTCFTDADCGGKVCTCREFPTDANRCNAGNCKVDADCGAGGYCSPSADPDKTNFGTTGWWCHTASDVCIDDTDCTGNNEKCVYDAAVKHWSCSNQAFLPP